MWLLILVTLLFLTICFSKPDTLGSGALARDPRKVELTHNDWIDPSERAVLEGLDKRLVSVLDHLMGEFGSPHKTPLEDRRLVERIERRLYVFPFLCVEQAGIFARVHKIIARVMHVLHPLAATEDNLEQKWAPNRF